MKSKTIEERASEALLESRKTVEVAGETYQVEPPTLATLMAVSAIIGKLSAGREEEETDDVTGVALRRAKDAPAICVAIATLILGVKKPADEASAPKGIGLWLGLRNARKRKLRGNNEEQRKQLAEKLLYNATPRELMSLLAELLEGMELGAFFGLTTFLRELNIARPTREVVR